LYQKNKSTKSPNENENYKATDYQNFVVFAIWFDIGFFDSVEILSYATNESTTVTMFGLAKSSNVCTVQYLDL